MTLGRHGFMLHFFHFPIQLQSCYIEYICLLVDKTQIPTVVCISVPCECTEKLQAAFGCII